MHKSMYLYNAFFCHNNEYVTCTKARQSQAFVWHITRIHKCIFIKWFPIQGKTREIKYLLLSYAKNLFHQEFPDRERKTALQNEQVCPWSDKSDSCEPYLIINEFCMCSKGKKSLYSTGNSILTDHLMVVTQSYIVNLGCSTLPSRFYSYTRVSSPYPVKLYPSYIWMAHPFFLFHPPLFWFIDFWSSTSAGIFFTKFMFEFVPVSFSFTGGCRRSLKIKQK